VLLHDQKWLLKLGVLARMFFCLGPRHVPPPWSFGHSKLLIMSVLSLLWTG